MGISKTLGSGLAAALSAFSLSTVAGAQTLPPPTVVLGAGDTYVVTTPAANTVFNFGGTIDIQAPDGAFTALGFSYNDGSIGNGGALSVDSGASLDNYGAIESSGMLTNSGTLTNLSGASLNSSGAFTNSGDLYIQSGATLINDGTLANNASVYNSGSLVNSGTLTSNQTLGNDGTIDNSGDVIVGGFGLMHGSASFTQTGGSLTVDGFVQQNLAVNGGTLGGTGFIIGNVDVDGGTVGPGNSPGALNVSGNIAFTAASTFTAELGGLVLGTEYDRLEVFGGTASLASGMTFDIDFYGTFVAGLGDTFDVLVADDILSPALSTMLFDFSGAMLGSGLAWDYAIVDLSGRVALRLSVVAEEVAAVPAPGAALLFGAGLLGLGVARRSRRDAH